MALIEELKAFAKLTEGSKQGEFYQAKVDSAKAVKVSRLADVLTESQISYIKNVIRPKAKECYKNATLVAQYLDCEYCEGMMLVYIGIDHAFNRVGDKYIDVTKEIALGENPTETEYITIGEYSAEQTIEISVKTGYYGNIFNELFILNKNL